MIDLNILDVNLLGSQNISWNRRNKKNKQLRYTLIVYIVILCNVMVSFIYVYLHCKVIIIINSLPFTLNGASVLYLWFYVSTDAIRYEGQKIFVIHDVYSSYTII